MQDGAVWSGGHDLISEQGSVRLRTGGRRGDKRDEIFPVHEVTDCACGSTSSGPNQSIEQSPCQDEATQPAEDIAGPQVAHRTIEVSLRLTLRVYEADQDSDD